MASCAGAGVLAAAALLLATAAMAQQPPAPPPAPPPIAAFGQLPTVSDIAVSPDGQHWAGLIGTETGTQIQVRRISDGALIAVTAAEKSKLRAIQWVGNSHVVLTITTTGRVVGLDDGSKREWAMLLALDLNGDKRWRQLLGNLENSMNVAAGNPVSLMIEGEPVLVVPVIRFVDNLGMLSLAQVRMKTGVGRVTDIGNRETVDWLVGSNGRAVARADYERAAGLWKLHARVGDRLTKVYEEKAPIDLPGLVSFGRDAGSVLVSRKVDGEWGDYLLDLATGTMGGLEKSLAGDNVLLDRAKHTIIGTGEATLDTVTYTMFDPADQRLLRGLARAFPGEVVRLESWSDDRQVLIIAVEGGKNGASLFLVNRAKGTADLLALRYAGLPPERIAPVSTLTYKAGDGMDIPAYLTLPRGRPAKGLPLIVLAHGGPASRDMPGFDWWAQALASRGYAVLQPQFRGSSGFGSAHLEAGYGQWGRKMQTDVSDGVRHLVAAGTVDKGRVCIVGASYGGYAAMAGVTVESGVYRCASAVAGVSDLRRMLGSEARDARSSDSLSVRYWQRFMGAKGNGDESIDAWSPARLAARVTVPLQLIHGKDDTVVPIAQSRMMLDAMKAAGKPVEWLEMAGEDHWLSRPATRIAMLEAQIAFLEKHNPPN